jgi:hypothetical protein
MNDETVIYEAHKLYMRETAREKRHNDDEYRKKLNARSARSQRIRRKLDPEYAEKQRQRARDYQRNPENKVKLMEKSHNTYKNRRETFFNILGSNCKGCGFNDKRALQIDHIFNDGGQQRKKFGGSLNEYKYYVKHIDEIPLYFQILCANCNWIKRANTDIDKRDYVRCEFPPCQKG